MTIKEVERKLDIPRATVRFYEKEGLLVPSREEKRGYFFGRNESPSKEDNEMNREIATEILEDAGLVVESAENGEMAIQILFEKGVDYP